MKWKKANDSIEVCLNSRHIVMIYVNMYVSLVLCSLNKSNWLLCFYRSSENKRSAKPKYNTDSRLSKSEFGKILSLAKKSKGGTIWFLLAFWSTGAWEQDRNFIYFNQWQHSWTISTAELYCYWLKVIWKDEWTRSSCPWFGASWQISGFHMR